MRSLLPTHLSCCTESLTAQLLPAELWGHQKRRPEEKPPPKVLLLAAPPP